MEMENGRWKMENAMALGSGIIPIDLGEGVAFTWGDDD
jgi:hypothetical protein